MIYEKIPFSTAFPSIPDTGSFMMTYIKDKTHEVERAPLPAVVIFPGGGYRFTSDRESEPIALAFNSLGFNCVVVRYSVAPHHYPQQHLEAAAAVAYVRRHAAGWNIDPDKIATCGFSAGGHLAAMIGNFWDDADIVSTLGIGADEAKPNLQILSYPVLTAGEFGHKGSYQNLLGEDAPKELWDKMSLENTCSEKTPRSFIWSTFYDGLVPCENALMMAQGLRKNGVEFELHIYTYGGHGLALCNENTSGDAKPVYKNDYIDSRRARWINEAAVWMQECYRGGIVLD